MPAPTAKKISVTHPFTGRDLPWLLNTRAEVSAEHTFLIWEPFEGESGRWTYREFAHEVASVAAGLVARGISQGDFVLIHLGNCPEFLIAWFACSRVGAVAVTTNTRSSQEELSYFATNSNAVAAITQPALLDLVQNSSTNFKFVACTKTDLGAAATADVDDHVLEFEALKGDPDAAPTRSAEPMSCNSVQYTSGTTSRPKGVVWTHANALWGAKIGATLLELTEDDITMVYLPLFHTNALSYSMLSTLWSGGTMVLQPRFSASRYWDVLIRYQCTWAIGIPFIIWALMKQPPPGEHNLRFWGLGASDVGLIDEAWKVKTLGWFGMTETITLCIMADIQWPNREMAMGLPVPGYEIAVLRDDGSPVDFGESGRLKIRGIPGLSLFLEYLNNREATAESFDEDGWFDTGDLVTPFEDGHIRFDMRDKDVLRVGAENVSPAEIEGVIFAAGGVTEVAVVGKPDKMLEEVPIAYVIPIGPDDNLAERLIASCRESLADFKVPREIIVVDDLPRVTLGKIDKKELRKKLQEESEQ